MKMDILFEEEVFEFLSKRILEFGNVPKDILFLLSKEGELYHDNILKKLCYSDSLLRPCIMSLYSAGFIDRCKEGNMKYYSINKNGHKLLNYLNGGL